jgi:hypothetical protein
MPPGVMRHRFFGFFSGLIWIKVSPSFTSYDLATEHW